MISFLRKICFRLLGQTPSDKAQGSLIEMGSARKYLLYAVGEIALVVIGITRAASRGIDCATS